MIKPGSTGPLPALPADCGSDLRYHNSGSKVAGCDAPPLAYRMRIFQ
jgi:hypothetical protein